MPSFGVVPYRDESKRQDVDIRGAKAIIAGVNYVEDSPEEFWGFYPIFGAWPGRIMNGLPIEPSIIPQLVESFNNGYHNAGVPDPLPIDDGHSSYEGGPQGALGYIVAVKEVDGERIVTYTSSGAMVKRGLPSGTKYLMGQIAWLPEGEARVASGQLPYISIAFHASDGVYVLERPGLCTAPADESLPALQTFKKEITMDNQNDPVYQAILQQLQSFTPEELQKVMDFLTGIKNPPATETDKPETEAVKTDDEKIRSILSQIFTSVVDEKLKAIEPKPVELTEGEIAARTEAFRLGVPVDVVEKDMKTFGMFSKLKPEEATKIVTMRYNRVEKEGHAISDKPKSFKDMTAKELISKLGGKQ